MLNRPGPAPVHVQLGDRALDEIVGPVRVAAQQVGDPPQRRQPDGEKSVNSASRRPCITRRPLLSHHPRPLNASTRPFRCPPAHGNVTAPAAHGQCGAAEAAGKGTRPGLALSHGDHPGCRGRRDSPGRCPGLPALRDILLARAGRSDEAGPAVAPARRRMVCAAARLPRPGAPAGERVRPASVPVLRDRPVVVRDGTMLRVNVYRPPGGGPFPVLMSAHPYGKDNLPRRRGRRLAGVVPVPGAAADGPGAVLLPDRLGGTRPGLVGRPRATPWSTATCAAQAPPAARRPAVDQEGEDVHDLIEWAAAQPWSTGDGRPARRLLPGHLAVEGGGAAAAGPEGDLPLGGLHRRLPRPAAPGRHPRGRLRPDVEPRAAAGAAALPA